MPARVLPPYRRIADDLRKAIATGKLAPGEKLKSENELKGQYGTTRVTVRKVLSLRPLRLPRARGARRAGDLPGGRLPNGNGGLRGHRLQACCGRLRTTGTAVAGLRGTPAC